MLEYVLTPCWFSKDYLIVPPMFLNSGRKMSDFYLGTPEYATKIKLCFAIACASPSSKEQAVA